MSSQLYGQKGLFVVLVFLTISSVSCRKPSFLAKTILDPNPNFDGIYLFSLACRLLRNQSVYKNLDTRSYFHPHYINMGAARAWLFISQVRMSCSPAAQSHTCISREPGSAARLHSNILASAGNQALHRDPDNRGFNYTYLTSCSLQCAHFIIQVTL